MDYAESSMGFRPIQGNDGACVVVKQQFQKKVSTGKKKKKLAKMMMEHAMSQNSFISRFQGLTLYNTPTAAYNLTSNYTSATDVATLPMFCWNLTSLPINGYTPTDITTGPIRILTEPMYVLEKQGATSTSPYYQWRNQTQIHGDRVGTASGITGWDVEWDTINGIPATTVNQYLVDWASAKFVFKGAAKRPVKIHTALCSFEHPGSGPRRRFFDGTNDIFYDGASTEELQDGVLYWDHFWATRVSNPIRTSRRPDNYNLKTPCHMWNHESFVLGEDVSINNDPLPLQATLDKFHRFDRPMKCVSPLIPYTQSKNVIGQNLAAGGAAFGFVGVEKTAGQALSGIGTTQGPFPQYRRDVYLLVWADVYDQSTNGTYADGSLVNDVSPSFDINLRCKYSYND